MIGNSKVWVESMCYYVTDRRQAVRIIKLKETTQF